VKHLILFFILASSFTIQAQEKTNPIIKSYGGIYDIPEATVKPIPDQKYKIVIDAKTGADKKSELTFALYNTARMLNLHVIGGVKPENLEVVLAIHGGATYSVVSNKLYKEKFGVENPNIALIKELKEAGVKLTVCGQSLMGRGIQADQVLPEIEIATSMLTTVSTYQLNGFAVFQF